MAVLTLPDEHSLVLTVGGRTGVVSAVQAVRLKLQSAGFKFEDDALLSQATSDTLKPLGRFYTEWCGRTRRTTYTQILSEDI